MKNILLSTLAVLAIGNSSLCADNSGLYLGVGYASTNVDLNLGLDNINSNILDDATDSAVIIAGYDFNEYLGLEGRYYWNVSSIYFDYYLGNSPISDTYEANSFALYVKPQYNFDIITVYGLLGGVSNDYTATKILGSNDDALFSWGLGVKFNLTQSFGIFVDYTDLGESDNAANIALNSWNAGITYRF